MIHSEIIIIDKCRFSKNIKMFLNIELGKEEENSVLPFDDDEDDKPYKLENQVTLKGYMIPLEEITPRN